MGSNVFQSISSLRQNIFGGGGSAGPSSLPPKRTPIELAKDKGPLEKLNNDPLDFSTLAYPLDVVNSPEIGHYMLFYINVNNKTRFPYTEAASGIEVGEGRYDPIREVTTTTYNEGTIKERKDSTYRYTGDAEFTPGASSMPSAETMSRLQSIDRSDVRTLRRSKTKMRRGVFKNLETTKRIMQSVAIYLPPNVQDTYTTTYNASATGIIGFLAASGITGTQAFRNKDFDKVAEMILGTGGAALEQVLKDSGASITEMLTGGEGAYEMFNKVFGRSANPYMEVLFQGPELRQFTYNFTFAPKSSEEQDEVKKIIECFRFHQAPERRSDHNLFLGLPAEFDIHYMYQPPNSGSAYENPFYNKIATCVLQSVNVDYTPGKVASHQQGAPVLIKMSLQFLETEMITKEFIKEGY
jgi:hypothetical protein